MSVLVQAVLFGLVFVIWRWWKSHCRAPPKYPGALPIIGHLHLMIKSRNVASEPEDVGAIANACLDKADHYKFTKDYLGNGLITADTRNLISQLKTVAGMGPVDVHEFLVKYILRIVCRTSLGLEPTDQDMIDNDYGKAVDEIIALFCRRGLTAWLHPPFIYNRTAMKRREQELINSIKNMMNQVIQKRKSDLKTNNNVGNDNSLMSGKFKPILDLLLHLSDEEHVLSDDEIREHLDTFVVASYDTTSTALMTKYTLRAGNTCILSMYGLHRHPSWGPDVKEFKPERWLNPDTLPTNPNVYAPFGIGKRNCIGKQYSMNVLKISLAHIVRNFHITSDIIVSDPDDASVIANICLEKSYHYKFSHNLIKNGLVTSDTATWKVHRKILNPAFRTSLGLKPEDQEMIDTDYAKAIDEISRVYNERGFNVWLYPSFMYDLSALKRKEKELITRIENIINSVIQKRRSDLKGKYITNDDASTDSVRGKFKPLLDLLLHLADEEHIFNDTEIREHLDTFVMAGNDTTSAVLRNTLLMLGTYPNVQERLFKEVKEVFHNEDLGKHDLTKLVYSEAVIKEVLRLHPPVPFVARDLQSDVVLPKYTLRAGNTCALSLYDLNRHSSWGPDAKEFNPDRWLNPETLPQNPYAFAGFSVGKRNCIGKKYAMMTLKTSLAHIVRKFHISGDITDLKWKMEVVLKPTTPALLISVFHNGCVSIGPCFLCRVSNLVLETSSSLTTKISWCIAAATVEGTLTTLQINASVSVIRVTVEHLCR
ncbi:hypothetical protein SFRURICE_018020 [Spodoptera frugiperda]|nr:hypothetical protein SFRURICE_018020 [Spodoptera frugiperda]